MFNQIATSQVEPDKRSELEWAELRDVEEGGTKNQDEFLASWRRRAGSLAIQPLLQDAPPKRYRFKAFEWGVTLENMIKQMSEQ